MSSKTKSQNEKLSINEINIINPIPKISTTKNLNIQLNIADNNTTPLSTNLIPSFQSKTHIYTKSNGNTSITNTISSTINTNTDNLKVAIRIRPPLPREITKNIPFRSIAITNKEKNTISLVEYIGLEINEENIQKEWISSPQLFILHKYIFDEIFDINSSQEEVYNISAKPAVDSVLEGYNSTIFAYGQTGTGKTFTMEGFTYDNNDKNKGIIPRTIENIFNYIENNNNKNTKFIIRAAYLQIYNEMISDLLKPNNINKNLNIREDKKKGLYVENLSEWAVLNPKDIYTLLEKGANFRERSYTNMNDLSSRSHAVFIIIVEQLININENKQITKIGKLNLVDLAGSERIRITGATGKQLEESKKINKSLSALGNVINALTDINNKKKHIPYRDSKLTRLLENSLGGNCKTTMIATISPAQCSFNESLSTLNFAKRAKNIKNNPIINEDIDHNCLIRQYENELKKIKNELEEKMKMINKTEELLKLKNKEEKEKNDVIKAYEQTSKQLIIERSEKEKLENKIKLMNLQMIKGGEKIEETPQFQNALQEKKFLLEKNYEQRIKKIEKEQIEDSQSQIEAYNKLLYQQRDIMDKLTLALSEKDKIISNSEKTIFELNNKIIDLNNLFQLKNIYIEELENLLDKNKIKYKKFANMSIEVPINSEKLNNKSYEYSDVKHNGKEYIGKNLEILSSEEKIKELNDLVNYQNKEISLLKKNSGKIYDNMGEEFLQKKFNDLQNENIRLNCALSENNQLIELLQKENESLEDHYSSMEEIFEKNEKENLRLINIKEKLISNLDIIIKKVDNGSYNTDIKFRNMRTDLVKIYQIVLDNNLNDNNSNSREKKFNSKKISLDIPISNKRHQIKKSSNNIKSSLSITNSNNKSYKKKSMGNNGTNNNLISIHEHKELSSENLKYNMYIDKNSFKKSKNK